MANIYTDIKLFDAEYYLANNADVAAAIEGTDITAQDHYFLHGAAENRAPNSWFNAAEYVAQNPDLADVDANLLLAHFALHGVNEGRAPNAATAGEDGKIKPALLADYVNAEGNEDVKAAIAEITGTPVGAELTAEQAAIAAQHFFAYGINEDRKGGIADEISGDDGDVEEAIIEALEAYQAALTAQAAAEKAEQDVAAKAAAAKLVDEAGKDEDYDIEDVAGKIAETLANDGALNNGVRTAADDLLPPSLEINEQSVALVKDAQASALATAQKQVDLLKAQNASVVTLQEKIAAYNTAAEEINASVIDYTAEAAKFGLANELGANAANLANADDAKAFQVSVTLAKGDVAQLTVVDGKLVVTGVSAEAVTGVAEKQTELTTAEEGLDTAKTALEAAQTQLGIAEAEAAAAQKWVDELSENEVVLTLDSPEGVEALLAKLEDVTEDESELFAVKGALDAIDTGAPEYDAVNAAILTARDAKLNEVAAADVEGKTTAVTTAEDDVTTAEEAVTAAKTALEKALTEGASDEAVEEFNKLKGVDAFKAQVEAIYGNIAKEAAAEKAIANATIAALKDAGYKVYGADNKVVAWSKVKIVDGQVVAAVEGDDTVYTLRALDKAGKPIDGKGDVALKVDLFETGSIDADTGNVVKESAKLNQTNLPKAIVDAAKDSKDAVEAVTEITKAMKAFDEALAKYNEAAELQKELDAATKAVEAADKAVVDAEKAFADLDINLVKAEDGVASGETYNEDDAEQFADLFVFSTALKTVNDFDGDDLFYFGDAAVALVVADKADLAAGKQLGGQDNVLEIFAVQNGANTDLYVEKVAFAGNSSNEVNADNKDFVKIELVGVNAEDLQFDGGFLTFA